MPETLKKYLSSLIVPSLWNITFTPSHSSSPPSLSSSFPPLLSPPSMLTSIASGAAWSCPDSYRVQAAVDCCCPLPRWWRRSPRPYRAPPLSASPTARHQMTCRKTRTRDSLSDAPTELRGGQDERQRDRRVTLSAKKSCLFPLRLVQVYFILLQKDNYPPWKKYLMVTPSTVTLVIATIMYNTNSQWVCPYISFYIYYWGFVILLSVNSRWKFGKMWCYFTALVSPMKRWTVLLGSRTAGPSGR